MSDDQLMKALGRVAAEQEQDRKRWETVGTEHARKSAGPRPDESASDELARQLFSPASEETVTRAADAVLGLLANQKPPGATVRTLRRRPSARIGVAMAPIAAAAAVALFLLRGGAAIPDYTLQVTGGLKESRSVESAPEEGPMTVAPGTEVVLVAQPDARTSVEVQTATFVLHDGKADPVAFAKDGSEAGAIRVTVQGEDVVRAAHGGGTTGAELVLVVGTARDLALHAPPPLSGAPARGRDWARFSIPVRLRSPAH